MKSRSTTVPTSRPLFASRVFNMLVAVFVAVGLAGKAGAQTYTISNIWNLPPATGTNNLVGGSDGGNRGLAYNGVSNQVFVAYRAGGVANVPIEVYDGLTGALIGGTNAVNGSAGLNSDQIGCSDDGVLFATPLFTSVTSSSFYKVYRWSDWNTPPIICFTSTATDPAVTALGTGTKRIGDTMAVTGSGANTLILEGCGSAFTAWVPE